jgi:hypothetical protein
MDTYRDDYGAVREQVESLKREMEDTKRALEEALALARVHETSAKTLEAKLKRTKPTRVLAMIILWLFIGFVFGMAFGDYRASMREFNKTLDAMRKCQDDARDARKMCDATIDRLKSVQPSGRF